MEATWEDTMEFDNVFPDFNLEDKVVPMSGVIIRALGQLNPVTHAREWA